MAEESCRILWSQVVLQAKEDLEQEPLGSILYNQAAAFFVDAGEWAKSRAMVAECLDIPADVLHAVARPGSPHADPAKVCHPSHR